MSITVEQAIGRALRRVKASNVTTRVPIVYRGEDKRLYYGTAWAREDLSPALRKAIDEAHGHDGVTPTIVIATREQARRADALTVIAWSDGTESMVPFTSDPSVVSQHNRVCTCPGIADGRNAHAAHAKIIFANNSRNAWCNDTGRNYERPQPTSRDAVAEDLTTVRTAARTPSGLDKRAQVIAAYLRLRTQGPAGRKAAADLLAQHGLTQAVVRTYIAERLSA